MERITLVETVEFFKDPPSDAMILFDGILLDYWETLHGTNDESSGL